MKSSDEIGQLAANFNNMTNQLVKRDEALCMAKEELENQVKKRTRELTIANRRYLDAFLEREWQQAKRENISLAFIMLFDDATKKQNHKFFAIKKSKKYGQTSK